MSSPSTIDSIRDTGPYSVRCTAGSPFVRETALIVGALADGMVIDDVRTQVHDGDILQQKSRVSRQTVWKQVRRRLFSPPREWVLDDLKRALQYGRDSREFTSLLYIHYAIRDRLTFDVITQLLWPRWQAGNRMVARENVLMFLDKAASDEPQVLQWSDSTRRKLAGSVLTGLRDFGLIKGVQKKELIQPVVPLMAAEHLLHILTEEGIKGRDVVSDPAWTLFFLPQHATADLLMKLAMGGVIRFERGGHTVVLETPAEWEIAE